MTPRREAASPPSKTDASPEAQWLDSPEGRAVVERAAREVAREWSRHRFVYVEDGKWECLGCEFVGSLRECGDHQYAHAAAGALRAAVSDRPCDNCGGEGLTEGRGLPIYWRIRAGNAIAGPFDTIHEARLALAEFPDTVIESHPDRCSAGCVDGSVPGPLMVRPT